MNYTFFFTHILELVQCTAVLLHSFGISARGQEEEMTENLFGMFVCMSCAPVDNIQELHFAILDPLPTIHNFFLKINWGFCSENKTEGL